MTTPRKSVKTSRTGSMSSSKRDSVSTDSANSSSPSNSSPSRPTTRRSSHADQRPLVKSVTNDRPTKTCRPHECFSNVVIRGIRKSRNDILVTIQPSAQHEPVEVSLDIESQLSLGHYYKNWDTKAWVVKKLKREVKLECRHQIDTAGRMEILKVSWPPHNFPNPEEPSFAWSAATSTGE